MFALIEENVCKDARGRGGDHGAKRRNSSFKHKSAYIKIKENIYGFAQWIIYIMLIIKYIV